jgi:NADH dehydrogenase/NADH:ubiquinone oxidoreductase subunit G
MVSEMYINGTTVLLKVHRQHSYSVLQHCYFLGIQIPRFCYHDQLSLVGNCRLCLVESGSSPKPVLACATEITDKLEIYTTGLLIKKVREQMLEFLLGNHPLYCPVCDQGGECDLQEVTIVFGSDRGRFSENKRTSHSFYFGPLVHVEMNRCIQCTRCIRFFDEIVGQNVLGTMGRGTSNTIATYIDLDMSLFTQNRIGMYNILLNSEIIGNVVDVCPVGALTFKPSKNMLRSWEVIVTETIDLLDSLCSNIRIDTCGTTILRVLPRLNVLLNNE